MLLWGVRVLNGSTLYYTLCTLFTTWSNLAQTAHQSQPTALCSLMKSYAPVFDRKTAAELRELNAGSVEEQHTSPRKAADSLSLLETARSTCLLSHAALAGTDWMEPWSVDESGRNKLVLSVAKSCVDITRCLSSVAEETKKLNNLGFPVVSINLWPHRTETVAPCPRGVAIACARSAVLRGRFWCSRECERGQKPVT